MNTPNNTTTHRPGYWLRAIEHRKNVLAHEYRKGLGAVAREGISDEDYATTMATLEKMATNLGWDESQKPERPFGRRGFGFGSGRGHRHPAMLHGHGFGPGHKHPHDETPEA